MPNVNWMIKSRNDWEMHGHAIRRHILSRQTRYQYVEVVDTFNYGRVLLLDGVPQSSQIDEFIYHEAIVHPALCSHSNPRNVLIIGGGEGAVLREVLKHSTVEHAVMVDIDSELITICREYFSEWHQGSFNDPRTLLIHDDGRSYLQSNADTFDCVVLDLSDPFEGSPANKLFTVEFYELVRCALRENGVVSLQAENGALGHNREHCRIVHTLSQVFPKVFPYYAHIPIYATLFGFIVCGGLGLTIGRLTSTQIDSTLAERGVTNLRFYDSQTAQGLFAVPAYIRRQLTDPGLSVITDSNPLVVTA